MYDINLNLVSLPECPDSVVEDTYKDLAKPVLLELGKLGDTIGKVANLLISPIRFVAVTGNTFMDKVTSEVAEKINLRGIAEENLIEAPLNISVPTLSHLLYTVEIEELRNLYSNLLVTSMDKNTSCKARASFSFTISQLEPLDVKIFEELCANRKYHEYGAVRIYKKDKSGTDTYVSFFTLDSVNIDSWEYTYTAIDNLVRLGLVDVRTDMWISVDNPDIQPKIKTSALFTQLEQLARNSDYSMNYSSLMWNVTIYGNAFFECCSSRFLIH